MSLATKAKKTQTTTREVFAECDEYHCDDLDAETCPHLGGRDLDRPDIQEIFEKFGPPDERLCDWYRSTVEPWFSLSRALGYVR